MQKIQFKIIIGTGNEMTRCDSLWDTEIEWLRSKENKSRIIQGSKIDVDFYLGYHAENAEISIVVYKVVYKLIRA